MVDSLIEGGGRKSWVWWAEEERASVLSKTNTQQARKNRKWMHSAGQGTLCSVAVTSLCTMTRKTNRKPTATIPNTDISPIFTRREHKRIMPFSPLSYLTINIYAYNSLLLIRLLKRSKWLNPSLNAFSMRVYNIHLPQTAPLPIVLHPSCPIYFTCLYFWPSLCWTCICRPLYSEEKNVGGKCTFEARPGTKHWSPER